MKNPCKICIVNPMCRESCSSYKLYTKKIINVLSPVYIIVSSLIMGIGNLWLFMEYPDSVRRLLTIEWLVGSVICLIVLKNLKATVVAPIAGLFILIAMPHIISVNRNGPKSHTGRWWFQ